MSRDDDTGTNKSPYIVYLTPFDINRVNRPMLLKNMSIDLLVYTHRQIIDYFKMWRIIAGLDKGSFSRRLGWAMVGCLFNLFLHKLRSPNVIILNPIGVTELRMLNNNSKIILDYMDVIIDSAGNLSTYHRKAISLADAVIFWSKALMKLVSNKYSIKQYTYIPYGVDLREFNPALFNPKWFRDTYGLKNKFLITYSGGLWKGPGGADYHGANKLPEIFRLVSKQINDVCFIVNRPYDAEFIRELKNKGVLNKVLWISPKRFNDPLRLGMYASSNILVLTASSYPPVLYAERMKVFEYLASGKAIVAEDTPGIRGVLKHNYNALLTALNDVQELASAIVELYYNKHLRKELGENAYFEAKTKYDWSILGPKYLKFVQKVFDEPIFKTLTVA